tara:strand:- start:234 stop:1256 length:1023 start_codon:yes stop_codon:yes gene_type:complete
MMANNKIYNLFHFWLITCLFLVFLIIIVGGLTRLTNSGLSITEWELFKGIFPPITQSSWNKYFDLYKEIPQYKILNFDMSLEQFKIIFYWEYFHRVLARIIGLFFLIPLIYFHFSKKIDNKYLSQCYLIFALIIFQGVIGWFMVKSGLINDVTVSHYRLSLHLITAILIISIIFWLINNLKNKTFKSFFKINIKNLPFLVLILIVYLQIIIGAFVSGLDAGKIYQTWPFMGYSYLPNDINFIDLKNFFNFSQHSLVQFYHRNLAYIITLYILILSYFIYKNKNFKLYKHINLLLIVLTIQIFLGIYTLVSGLNIYLASAHQICSVLLVFSTINLYYNHAK